MRVVGVYLGLKICPACALMNRGEYGGLPVFN